MARFLLDHSWTLSQLNMGEGKTRVILPMLLLELAQPGGGRLVRRNFLSQLLCEAYDFLHRSLTASLFVRRLVRLPFHGDVRLSAQGARRMAGVLARCRDSGGSLVMAPEHRLSLRLKADEARLAGDDALLHELAALDGHPSARARSVVPRRDGRERRPPLAPVSAHLRGGRRGSLTCRSHTVGGGAGNSQGERPPRWPCL